MHGARLPARRIRRDLLEDTIPCRALATRRQTEDFNIRRQRPHMEGAKRRLRSAGGLVMEMAELEDDDLMLQPKLSRYRGWSAASSSLMIKLVLLAPALADFFSGFCGRRASPRTSSASLNA